jgi:hypothetical protein
MNDGDENVDPNSPSSEGRKGQGQVELEDVEMYSDSPLKPKGPVPSHHDELKVDPSGTETSTEAPSGAASNSVLRPISLNGVKKELKRRLKDHGISSGSGPGAGSGAGAGALVLRETDEDREEGEEFDGDETLDVSARLASTHPVWIFIT